MHRVEGPQGPWRSFFDELDSCFTEEVQLHCCGGFVVTNFYGVARDTNDVAFLSMVPKRLAESRRNRRPGIRIASKAQALLASRHDRNATRKLRGTAGVDVPGCMAPRPPFRVGGS